MLLASLASPKPALVPTYYSTSSRSPGLGRGGILLAARPALGLVKPQPSASSQASGTMVASNCSAWEPRSAMLYFNFVGVTACTQTGLSKEWSRKLKQLGPVPATPNATLRPGSRSSAPLPQGPSPLSLSGFGRSPENEDVSGSANCARERHHGRLRLITRNLCTSFGMTSEKGTVKDTGDRYVSP